MRAAKPRRVNARLGAEWSEAQQSAGAFAEANAGFAAPLLGSFSVGAGGCGRISEQGVSARYQTGFNAAKARSKLVFTELLGSNHFYGENIQKINEID